MPIYAYRCTDCGHTKDVLQKLSDPVLTQCPACGADSFAKQLTAAGFQLKGSGWYVTDFRDGKKPEASADAKSDGKSDSTPDAKPAVPAAGGDAKAATGTAAAAAPAAAPAPAAPAAKAPPAPGPAAGK